MWHVEGMRNECIVASGIAYYEQHNIGPSSLAFRTSVNEPEYEQNDERGVEAIYGLRNEEALVQPLGAVDTREGRCIAFPNVFQHRVAPFGLLDPDSAGPPRHPRAVPRRPARQRAEHEPRAAAAGGLGCRVRRAGTAVADALGGAKVLAELVQQYVGWPMTRAEAEQHREALMHERKYFVQANTEQVYERAFSLCEH